MNFSTNTSEIESGGLMLKGDSFAIWVSTICLSVGYFVATTYIMVMLITDMCTDGVEPSGATESVGKQMRKWIKISRFIFVAICNIHYLIGWLGQMLVDLYYPESCYVYKSCKLMIESGAACFTYLTVWIRHRIIHSIPAMKHATNLATRILSIVVLVLAVTGPILNRLLVILRCSAKVVQEGCFLVEFDIPFQIPIVIFGVSSIVMQVIILGLFLHPLRQHQKNIGTAADNLTPMLKKAYFAVSLLMLRVMQVPLMKYADL
uniref:uncharacterized protein LOC120329796 n=1 Tax=Styela clava TaxID=7725 RepID=UPI001939F362|nr:uncharacterized protein LOC120329796 [Styela clava]